MLTRTTSTVLARRTSSLTLRVRGHSDSTREKHKLPGPRVPCEIIEAIVSSVLLTEPKFCVIRPFTRASKKLREISLRLYFRNILIDTPALFVRIWDYLSVENEVFGGSNSFGWVRSFIFPSHILAISLFKNIGSFVNLQALEISFGHEGLNTQNSVVHRLFDSFAHSPSRKILEKLALTEIPRIDNLLLDSLSATFPQLKSLEIGSTKRIDFDCCATCLENSLSYLRHSPIPDYFANAEKFAISFARSLAPLTKLKDLYLGILLSDADILEEHLTHSDETKGGGGILNSFPLCAACGEFQEETHRRERLVSSTLSKALPSLTTIRWDTLFIPLETGGLDIDEDGFYYSRDGNPFQIPSAIIFLIHRHADTGEVRDVSFTHL